MPVRCYTRKERGDLHVLLPLEGRLKHNCLLVNDTVMFVYEQLLEGISLDELTRVFVKRAETLGQGSEEEQGRGKITPSKVKFDLYRILVLLKDHEICDYIYSDLAAQLLPRGKLLKGTSQVLPVGALAQASEFLMQGANGSGAVQTFFSAPVIGPSNQSCFGLEGLARRHLDQEEVCFVRLDKRANIEACSSIRGFTTQPSTLTIWHVAGRFDSDSQFEEAVGSHLAETCGLLSVVTLSPKVRFLLPTGEDPDVRLHGTFPSLIGELGFRKAFDLRNEFGEGKGLVGYDKTLL